MFRFAGSDKVTLLVPLDLFGFRARVQCRGRVHHRRQYSESSVAVSTFGAPRDHRLPFPWPENFYFQNSKQHYYNIVSLSYVHPSVSCVSVCVCATVHSCTGASRRLPSLLTKTLLLVAIPQGNLQHLKREFPIFHGGHYSSGVTFRRKTGKGT